MQYSHLIFDLDGTISDPIDGIVNSFNYSLEHHGFNTRSEQEIAIHIGPPLDKMFAHFIKNADMALISSLVSKYRERYAKGGYEENVLYDGIRESLIALHKSDRWCLGVCTSKRADFAEKILKMFDLRGIFDFVSGGDVGIEKWQQLESLLQTGTITKNSIMIGDRSVDLTAAHKNHLHSAGVLWGYGSREELEHENPRYIFQNPEHLKKLINTAG